MIEELEMKGDAVVSFVPACRYDDDPDFDEDPGSLELIIPVAIKVVDDESVAAHAATKLHIELVNDGRIGRY